MSASADPPVVGSTRRRATVTISAPDATRARSIVSRERKPPVPTMSRDPQIRPPSSSAALPSGPERARCPPSAPCRSPLSAWRLATLHRPDDLDRLSLLEVGLPPVRLANHLAVDRHRDSTAAAVRAGHPDRVGDRRPLGKLRRTA